MKKVKKKLLVIVVSIVLIVVFGPLAFSFVYFGPVGAFVVEHHAHLKQIRLLCNTDHKQLLEACRELSKQVATGELKPGKYCVDFYPDPESSRFPKPILELKPTSVFIDIDGRVMIEMLGGLFGHFGFYAFPKDYVVSHSDLVHDVKIIDGLWYYDDNCRRDEEYKKMIQSLIQRGKLKKTG